MALDLRGWGVSSSFKLRLGLSPEKSRISEDKHQLSTGSNLNGIHVEPSEVFLQDKLLQTSYSPEIVNFSSMKNLSSSCQTTRRYCGEVMANDVDDRAQTSDSNKATGGSDKDEHNQLLRCNRFLLKGLPDEADGVDIITKSLITIPDSDRESLQPGNKLVCAGTEESSSHNQLVILLVKN